MSHPAKAASPVMRAMGINQLALVNQLALGVGKNQMVNHMHVCKIINLVCYNVSLS